MLNFNSLENAQIRIQDGRMDRIVWYKKNLRIIPFLFFEGNQLDYIDIWNI